MGKQNIPKFAVGDSVVILVNGIVGVVTNVKEMNHAFLYEVQGAEGIYTESALIHLQEFEGLLFDAEQINIDYKFFFGDLVQVKGYGKDIFKVIGFRTEIWRYQEESWEDVIYELSRIDDEEWLECNEDDLYFLADAKEADTFLANYQESQRISQKGKQKQKERLALPHPKGKVDDHEVMVNHLLDIYNDYRILKELFGDESYEKVMKTAVKKLQKLVSQKQDKKEPH